MNLERSNRKTWQGERRQIAEPYQSTIMFTDFLAKNGCFRPGSEILDIGTGLGANLIYFKQRLSDVRFLGIDYNPEKIDLGARVISEQGIEGIDLQTGDWFDLPIEFVDRFDGVTNIHTMCCFKQPDQAINALCDLKPRWIALNSLFCEGPLDVLIHIRDYRLPHITDDNPDGDFNIFSLDRVAELFAGRGYSFTSQAFYPESPLEKREHGGRGTYTMKTELHPHTQFSGPVHLPWHFVLASLEV